METNLNRGWAFYKTQAEFDAAEPTEVLDLPHTWNAKDGQDGGNDYYRGTCRYVRTLTVPDSMDNDVYLQFDGVAMNAEVFLNGEKIGTHQGGYSTFRVNITDKLKPGENSLLVEVNNGRNHTYPQNADFTFYGGIYRDVKLLVVPKTHFSLDYYGANGFKVTPIVTDLAAKTVEVHLEAWITGHADTVTFTATDAAGCVIYTEECPVSDGYAQTVFTLQNAHLWDGTDDPYLYCAAAALANGEKVSCSFGCRKFEIDPQKGFYLNGRSYPLRGVSRHQDRADVGNALTAAMQQEDMQLIREIGANSVRLAHYQHAQEFYDLCDRAGIIAWAEIPYITMHDPAARENTVTQMTELIAQCYNHPCIACWGLSNEISVASTVDDNLLENHRVLNDLCHRMDSTRPTTIANAFMLEIDSPLLEIPDLNTYNLYFGWYMGELTENEEFFDTYHTRYPQRCIGFSEYGADTNIRFHSATPSKGDYTEEYQCVYHEHILQLLASRPWIWASYVWNMFDFAADGRDEGGAHGLNQKGLVTFDRKIKKDAFYLYKAYWSKAPFVYITGRRFEKRTGDTTEIKVYSNLSEVSLYQDGVLLETQRAEKIFRFTVPLTGQHEITAKAGVYTDTISVTHVTEAVEDYVWRKQPDVVNWFDSENFKPDCYSIYDTVGEIEKCSGAYALVEEVLDGAAESRGEIAVSAAANPAMKKMINRQTLQNLIKLAGIEFTEAQFRRLNNELQQFEKVQ